MANERVVEIPWALMQLPHTGTILDVGSCEATYLANIQYPDRKLYCMDVRDCHTSIPAGAVFYRQSIIGNTLPRAFFDAVLILSVLEHIGLPCYEQEPFALGDRLSLAEVWGLLKPGCPVIVTVPAGQGKLASWYRQYSPAMLNSLFQGWRAEIRYWGFNGTQYQPISEHEVEQFDYRDHPYIGAGAGAFAGIVAYRT